jgi:hypothetical protein
MRNVVPSLGLVVKNGSKRRLPMAYGFLDEITDRMGAALTTKWTFT